VNTTQKNAKKNVKHGTVGSV